MSNSDRRILIPSFEVPQAWLSNPKKLALLAIELALLLLGYDNTMDDFICFTNPAVSQVQAIWREAAGFLRNIMHGLTLPIFKLLSRYRGDPNPQIISGVRYLEAGEVSIDEAIRTLRDIQYRALLKLHCWIRDYYPVLSQLGHQVTARTLPELLIHGILLTRQCRESFPNVGGWLASLPQARQGSQVQPALKTSLEMLSRTEWLVLHGYRTNIQALGIGFTHCVTVIYSGERHYAKLHTGSTLINWGAHLSQLVPRGGGTENLQTWFRKERQLRFEEKEQKIVDLLVKEALDR